MPQCDTTTDGSKHLTAVIIIIIIIPSFHHWVFIQSIELEIEWNKGLTFGKRWRAWLVTWRDGTVRWKLALSSFELSIVAAVSSWVPMRCRVAWTALVANATTRRGRFDENSEKGGVMQIWVFFHTHNIPSIYNISSHIQHYYTFLIGPTFELLNLLFWNLKLW